MVNKSLITINLVWWTGTDFQTNCRNPVIYDEKAASASRGRARLLGSRAFRWLRSCLSWLEALQDFRCRWMWPRSNAKWMCLKMMGRSPIGWLIIICLFEWQFERAQHTCTITRRGRQTLSRLSADSQPTLSQFILLLQSSFFSFVSFFLIFLRFTIFLLFCFFFFFFFFFCFFLFLLFSSSFLLYLPVIPHLSGEGC